MSSFKSYKIRDGVHLPSEKFKENWDSIFGKKPKKPKKETMKKEDACEEQKLHDPEYITQGQLDNLKKELPIGTMVGSMKLVAYKDGNPVFKPTNPKTLDMIKSLNKKQN